MRRQKRRRCHRCGRKTQHYYECAAWLRCFRCNRRKVGDLLIAVWDKSLGDGPLDNVFNAAAMMDEYLFDRWCLSMRFSGRQVFGWNRGGVAR